MKTNLIIGVLLILLGLLFLGPSLGLFTLQVMWPAILLIVGLGFFVACFAAPTMYGFLMPGAVLVVSSIPFFICTFSGNWQQMTQLWPIFVISVSIGFFLMYFIGKRDRGLLIPALILLLLGIVSFLVFNYIRFIFPIIFIGAGLVLVFLSLTARKKGNKQTETVLETPKSEKSEPGTSE